jgi:hypothetical protein
MTTRRFIKAVIPAALAFGIIAAAAPLRGQPVGVGEQSQPRGSQQVGLPYSFHDGAGMQWDIQPDGTIGPGNADVFDSGARLMVGPNVQYTPPAPQAQFDAANNEITLPAQSIAGLNVSRRISVNTKSNWLRFVEVLENRGAAPVKVPVHVMFQVGQAIESAQPVGDGKKQDRTIGLAIFDNQRGIAFLGAGRGSKLALSFTPQPGGNTLDEAFDEIEVPARQKVALVHVIAIRPTRNDAESFLQSSDERQFLAGLPGDLARRVINFPPRSASILNRDILRGDLLDIVELRSGDQYKGTLRETKYSLQTPYGPVDLPAAQVVGMLSVGEHRPYQLVVTSDGQAFGGVLGSSAIHLELSSGQITPIPLASIARLGYRRRASESEEPKVDGPLLVLRSGDRLRVRPPTQPIVLATRHGRLELKPQMIASLNFQSDESSVHQVVLTDGSQISGLIDVNSVRLELASGASAAAVSFPQSAISRLELGPMHETDDQAPLLTLSGADRLIGTIGGVVALDTAFDSLKIEGAQIRGIAPTQDSPGEIQVTMWDGAIISGRVNGDALPISLHCGAAMNISVSLVEKYSQPYPIPSAATMKVLDDLLADLAADDQARSNHAAERLRVLGPSVAGGLRSLREKQPPAARERLDKILEDFAAALKPRPGASAAPASAPNVEVEAVQQQVDR